MFVCVKVSPFVHLVSAAQQPQQLSRHSKMGALFEDISTH